MLYNKILTREKISNNVSKIESFVVPLHNDNITNNRNNIL